MTDDDEITEPEEPARQSDHAIACTLLRGGYIRAQQYDVWIRSRAGATIYSMRRDYPNQMRGNLPFGFRTLYTWVQEVDAAIAAARVVEAPEVVLPSPFGISIASGHQVRRAGDPTPAGRVPTEQSTWDAERLRAAGAVDRYSRKRR